MTCHDIAFVSQRRRPCAACGCGIAAMTMVLRAAVIAPLPRYPELIRALRLHAAGPDGEPPPVVHPANVERFFRERRIAARGMRRKSARALRRLMEWLRKAPVMALVQGPEWSNDDHWVVLIGEERGMLVYLDPWYSPAQRFRRRMSRARFRALWRGAAFSVMPAGARHRMPER